MFVIILICIVYFYIRPPDGYVCSDSKKSDFSKKFYPFSYKVYLFLKNKFHVSISNTNYENYSRLFIGKDKKVIEALYYQKIISIVLMAVMVFALLSSVELLSGDEQKNIYQNYFIKREEPQQQNKMVEVQAEIGEEKRDIAVDVRTRQYTEKELKTQMKTAEEYVLKNYLGENKSSEEIEFPLNIIHSIPDSAVTVEWDMDRDNIIQSDGSLDRSEVIEPVQVTITANLIYLDTEKEIPINITVLPINKSREELLWEEWDKAHEEASELTKESDYLRLPDKIGDSKVTYSEKTESKWGIIIICFIVVMFMIPIVLDSKLKSDLKQREQELRREYPEFVEKFVLLISAGLNCKGAWYRITDEYIKKNPEKNKKNYLYDEMLFTRRQLENGMNESKAYELFGRRIGLHSYMKFCTLIIQNMKKGSSDLLKILDYEATDVLNDRRENAKMIGEQAGTKMLMPMGLMLVEVFAIIIYAAFQGM